MNNEPLITVASVTAGVAALIAVLIAFGVPLTPDQQTAILGFVAVAAPVIVAWIARRFVSPTSSVVAQRLPGGDVVAGEASSIETGKSVEVVEYAPEDEVDDTETDEESEVIEPH